MKIKSNHFMGFKISEYGEKHGYVDYATLAKCFDSILANETFLELAKICDFEILSGGGVDNSAKIEVLEEKIEELEEKIEELDEEAQEFAEFSEEIEDLRDELDELEDEQGAIPETYQYFIVDTRGADLLQKFGEIVFYFEKFDLYFWAVDHYGTSWDYVLTNIEFEKGVNEEK